MSNEKKIKIVVDKTGAQRALTAVNQQLGAVGLRADGLDKSFVAMTNKAVIAAGAITGTAAAIGVAVNSAVKLATSTAAAVVEIDTLAKRSGIATSTLQAWSAESKKIGVDNERLGDTFQDVSDRVGEFIRNYQQTGNVLGGGEFTDIYTQYLEPLNIGIEELRNLKPDEVLNLVKKGMDAAGASTNEMVSAFEQLASNSSWVIPLLDGTGKSMENIKNQMEREGTLFSDDDITNAKILDDKAKDLGTQWDAVKTKIGLAASGPTSTFLKFLDDSLSKTQQLIKDTQSWMDKYDDKLFGKGGMLYSEGGNERLKAYQDEQSLFNGGGSGISKSTPVNKTDVLSGFGYKTVGADAVETDDDKVFAEFLAREAKEKEAADKKAQSKADAAARELANLSQQADEYLNSINQLNMDEFELIEASLISKKDLLDSYRSDGAITAEEHRTATLQLEQAAADASYDILFNEAEKEKALAEKTAKDKAKSETTWNKQILQNDMSIAKESLALIGDTAEEGSALRIAAMIAEKGIAASQVFMQYEVAAAMAMAQLGPIAGIPVAATMKTQAMISMGLIAAQGAASLASRQGGGDMSGTYQTGGGAHTSAPEMFTDRITGKSYMTGNGNMTPAHQLKQGGSGGGFGSVTIINNGQPMQATQSDGGLDENDMRRMILTMTPEIMAQEGGNPSSHFNQSRGTIEKIQPEFN